MLQGDSASGRGFESPSGHLGHDGAHHAQDGLWCGGALVVRDNKVDPTSYANYPRFTFVPLVLSH